MLQQLRAHRDALLALLPEGATAQPTGHWRILIESCRPRQGPIKINVATTVTDPVLCIEHILVELERAVLTKRGSPDGSVGPAERAAYESRSP